MKEENPVDNMGFYSKNDLNTAFKISKDQVRTETDVSYS